MSYIYGEEPIKRMHRAVVSTSVGLAKRFWSTCPTVETLPDVVEWLRRYLSDGQGLGFYNYVQAPLAAAFIAAKNADMAQALAELEKFIDGHELSTDTAKRLRQLLRDEGARTISPSREPERGPRAC
jgi:hypothetical protein